MKKITFSDPHRKKHFDFFRNMDQPHFNVTANVDITVIQKIIKKLQLPFTPVMVYCIAATANSIPAFRYRIRGEEVVEHEIVHPSFSVLPEVSEVFSFCYVDFQDDFYPFLKECNRRMEIVRKQPSFEDEPGRDDYLFLSSFPWFSFTGVMHPMHYNPVDSVPRIAWGKYFEENGKVKMPLTVQAHHAVVDGLHLGAFLQQFQEKVEKADFLKKRGNRP